LPTIGCHKDEGEGGTNSIYGTIIIEDYNSSGQLKEVFPGYEEKVYILYGSTLAGYDDDATASYDGTYRFDYLYPGHYRLFAYEDCDSCPGGTNAKFVEVEFDGRGKMIQAPELRLVR
jgi:hypothetical protein